MPRANSGSGDSPTQRGINVGDKVTFIHAQPLGGVVSSIDRDEAMVCMPIGGSYQLRGPVSLDDLALEQKGDGA